jgi:hypothetical protein
LIKPLPSREGLFDLYCFCVRVCVEQVGQFRFNCFDFWPQVGQGGAVGDGGWVIGVIQVQLVLGFAFKMDIEG